MSGTIPKYLRDLHKVAGQKNWTVRQTGRLHLRWESPDGETVVLTAGTGHGGRNQDVFKLRKALGVRK